jgi:pimeloyl-ACP methyl ester carboxylesterase
MEPRPDPVSRNKRGLTCAVVATLLWGAAMAVSPTAPAEARSAAPAHVRRVDACVIAQATDGSSEPLTGSRWLAASAPPDAPAIVLAHGAFATHGLWDQPAHRSVARMLAASGFDVYAFDWLGPNSPAGRPEGDGRLERADEVQDFLHRFVAAVRAGTVRTNGCDGPVTGARPHSLALVGTSGGALYGVSGYAGRYDDADAIVQAGWSHFGFSPTFADIFGRATGRAVLRGDDSVSLFKTQQECEDVTMYKPGIEEELVDELCDLDQLVTMPLGYLTSVPTVYARNLTQIPRVGSTAPVLLTWSDHEAPWTPEQQRAEESLWRTTCRCDLTVWTQPDAGHTFMWHRTSDLWVDQVVEWLAARGITAGRRPGTGAGLSR